MSDLYDAFGNCCTNYVYYGTHDRHCDKYVPPPPPPIVVRLAAALRRYGQHGGACPFSYANAMRQMDEICTCGLNDVLRECTRSESNREPSG